MAMGSAEKGGAPYSASRTREIVVAGVIGGVALFLGFTRLGFIPVPIPFIGNATIMHIPAIVGGALEGPMVGLLAGAIFGIFSFYTRTTGLLRTHSRYLAAVADRRGGVGRLRRAAALERGLRRGRGRACSAHSTNP